LKAAKALKSDGGISEIKYHALDIADSKSIQTFVHHLKQSHGEGIDFVINNAGIALDGFGKAQQQFPTISPGILTGS
jgi:carbonyl reductase 1